MFTTPWRDIGVHQQFAEPQRGQRRFLGRLQHDGATGRQGRADLPDARAERPVPRNDRADNADRLLQGVGEIFAGQRVLDRLAMDRSRHAGIPAQHAEHPLLCAPGSADRRTHIERVEQAELVVMLLDDVSDLEQQRLALIGFPFAP
jgi:hypothetical protein